MICLGRERVVEVWTLIAQATLGINARSMLCEATGMWARVDPYGSKDETPRSAWQPFPRVECVGMAALLCILPMWDYSVPNGSAQRKGRQGQNPRKRRTPYSQAVYVSGCPR